MALSLDDEGIDRLAEQAQKILNAPSKTEAIRQALERVVDDDKTQAELKSAIPLRERLDRLRQKFNLPSYESLEPFDDKAFFDDMWGHNDVHR
jgi:antitoxin VapB